MKLKNKLWSLAIGGITTLLTAIPSTAAEKIIVNLETIEFSIKVSSLEQFAKDGTVNKELGFYLSFINPTPEELEKFRGALTQTLDVNAGQLYRYFHEPMGKNALRRLGMGINIQGNINGLYAIRGALVAAAASPQKLSFLSFVQQYPTNLELNAPWIIFAAKRASFLAKATEILTDTMAKLSAAEAKEQVGVDFAKLPPLWVSGKYEFTREEVTLTDKKRNRTFLLITYKPNTFRSGKTPVVIISHGLASRPQDFEKQAKILASYGYVVALPQHPGSDTIQLQNFLNGYSGEVFKVNEFIDRPLDISYVIDELQRRNASEFGNRLDLENVGVAGHSFGGYTVMAIAGATIDFEYLQENCSLGGGMPNTSLLLQCRALELPRKEYNFRDSRVKAVIGLNPVQSAVFGPKGLSKIAVPVLVGAGTNDPAAPAVLEQIRVFPWLTTPNKYLVLEQGQAHVDFSSLDAGTVKTIETYTGLAIPPEDLQKEYGGTIIVSFFETYIAKDPSYKVYLQSGYFQHISKDPFNAYFISAKSIDGLVKVGNQLRQEDLRSNIRPRYLPKPVD